MLATLLLPLMLLTLSAPALPASTGAPPAVSIHLATENWPGFTNEDYSGAYFELIKLIYPTDTLQLQVTFTNFNRALHLVQQQKVDMTLAVSGQQHAGLTLSEQPMDQDKIIAVFVKDGHMISSIADLTGLRLGWNLAYDFGNIIGMQQSGYEVLSVEQGVDMALNKRLDVYLAERSQVNLYLQQHPVKAAQLSLVPIAVDNTYAAFAATEHGLKLKQQWDSRFKTLQQNGELQRFYQHYPDLYLPAEALPLQDKRRQR